MKIVIAGAYVIGTYLSKLLARDKHDITLISGNSENLDNLSSEYDLLTIDASPSSFKAQKEAGVQDADLFVAVTPDEHVNLTSCLIAHSLGAKKTVAKVDNPEYVEANNLAEFKSMGINSIVLPDLLAAKDIVNGLKMSWVRQRWDVHGGALVMLCIKLRSTCTILDRPLKETAGPEEPYHVLAIKRHGETIIPGGNSVLKKHDLVYFMTTKNYIPYLRKVVGKEHYVDVKNVMIMGGGSTAVRAVEILPDYMNVKVIEQDIDRCEYLNEVLKEDTLVINGDGRDLSLLTEEGILSTQAFVSLASNAETNILACLTAKEKGVRKTVAMVENEDYYYMAESLDIGTLVNKKAVAASHIYQMMLDANVENVKFLMSVNADVAEFIPVEGSKITQKEVKDIHLPQGVIIGGVVRGNEGILVSGNSHIQAGDIVVMFCHNVDLKKVENLFL
ncbi:Trk system potassium transporter TrkA [Prevotella amnii]|jgi:trkA C-terminal domain protein|uniref:Trk system potassium uptake protein TrkA n=2 Tax=Prevotella amnii TaxID=419005 RepID=A0A134BF90_9BACT|nr:Trk system potassium transporter TrkA [Prevotella amnii]EFN90373.1 potassium transporter peripheral membrane component [Prevotella amnii CRIS 21A-A]KXB78559.1 potassium transporter peripheral membrane component [Prevotella amnii]